MYNLIDKIVSHDNLNRAYKRVKSNKGSAGIDEMEVEQLLGHLVMNKKSIISQIRDGSYEPKPVKRVLIDKEDGSKRKLGVPTVTDRFVQQAISQVIEMVVDPTFSDLSFGFRPRRSAHDAMKRAKEYYEDGYRTVVDIDMNNTLIR